MKWDGGVYSGMINMAGVPHGLGRRVGISTIYEGQFINGKKTGFAREISIGYTYVGFWDDGYKHGQGYQVSASNHVNQGIFVKDKLVKQ